MMKQAPRSNRSTSFDLGGIQVQDKVVFLKELNERYAFKRKSSLTGGFFIGLSALAIGGVVFFVGRSVLDWFNYAIEKVREFSIVEYMKEWFTDFFKTEEEEESNEPPVMSADPSTAVPRDGVGEQEGAPPKETTKPSAPSLSPKAAPTKPSRSKAADTALRRYQGNEFGVAGIPEAVSYASRLTGVNQSILYAFAYKESRFGTLLNNKTTSAKGVWQLLSSTYDDIKERYGKRYPILKAGVHNLKASAVAAALMIRELSQTFHRRFKVTPSVTDLYMMYLLGPSGGLRFLETLHKRPRTVAAETFKIAARHNRSVFYDEDKPRTVFQVYQYLHSEVGEVARKLSFTDNSPKIGRVEAEGQVSVTVKQETVMPVTSHNVLAPNEFFVNFDRALPAPNHYSRASEPSAHETFATPPQEFIRSGRLILST